jgi:betaine-homocysteine S-methyltransferase
MYEPGDPASPDKVRRTFDEQLDVQVAEGVDFIIGETFSYVGEALLAVERAKATKLPVMVTVCFENEDVTTDGRTAAQAARELADAGADVVGINCLRSPEHTLPLMKEMRDAVRSYIGCQPVAYRTTHTHRDFTSLPAFPDQLEPYQLTRREMSEYAAKAREMGINYIGSCCGAVATHVREMARALGKLPEDDRVWKKGGTKAMSAYEYYDHDNKPKA